jgi:hypothetical protein
VDRNALITKHLFNVGIYFNRMQLIQAVPIDRISAYVSDDLKQGMKSIALA